MYAITSCDTKGNSTTPTSPDDDPKSGIEGNWVAIDTFVYNNWRQEGDIVMIDKTGYNAVYIFRKGKMSAFSYKGMLDGDDYMYYIDANIGVAVDYWLENGVLYNSLLPEGRSITYFDDKHMQIEGGFLLRKVDNIKQASKQSPFPDAYWAGCDNDGNLKVPENEGLYVVYRFEENYVVGMYETDLKNGVFPLSESYLYESRSYIYAPNNKEIYLGYSSTFTLSGNFSVPLQILQENGEMYLGYGSDEAFLKIYKKVDVGGSK